MALGVQVAGLVGGSSSKMEMFQASRGLNTIADGSGTSRLVDVCGLEIIRGHHIAVKVGFEQSVFFRMVSRCKVRWQVGRIHLELVRFGGTLITPATVRLS